MATAITVTNLSKSFGAVRAVDEVSFTVEPGAVTAFLGPNGAGKTTTLRMILGLVAPTAGTAMIGRTPYIRLASPITKVGAVLEATAFHPGLSARAHLDVLRTAAGLAPARVDLVLDQVDLTCAADRKIGGFSLGMRQRLAIASALLGDPEILILDEPANGLDPQGISWLRSFLRAYAHEGRAVLVSTHVLAEIERIANRALIISAGRLVRQAELTPDSTDLEHLYLEATR
ncbi:ATP-binding cassette domain-containing protein [Nonomuraea sp. KC401]|uniref:ABC transporter ATP-binding protein n=1 Tax=unclassified Nonomuraea TaxID=2593643 RepID=UPI0010FEE178|nr:MULTISPECIES: ATP-binding cassette domain-containing protein [unclassified Nonomuraea]NBE96753.1 ATP-binding cassette domain-containing protein [Nonomuraea sp. K271]TLF78970.1 ATP-binding cassette domain-containing protein [Nonomuraea sp. KC401]